MKHGSALRIVLNGEPREFAAGMSIGELLSLLEVQGRFAVEVNGEIVPRSRFDAYHLNPDDTVEIVKAIGGG